MADDRAFSLTDFDRYVEENGIPKEDWPAAFASGSPSGRRSSSASAGAAREPAVLDERAVSTLRSMRRSLPGLEALAGGAHREGAPVDLSWRTVL
jgi:hypothetical protein